MTISDLLVEQARLRPSQLAVVDLAAERNLTFAELESEVAEAAGWWRRQGIGRGSAVLVFVPMSATLYVALLALFRLGAVALFLDPSAGRSHLERCCARWAPDALLAVPKAHALRLVSPALRRIRLKVTTVRWLPGTHGWLGGRAVAPVLSNDAQPEDPALVTFTSGSTGVPKGAVRTQAFLLAQFRALAPSIALEGGEVDYATLPVFTLANLAAGGTTVIGRVDLRRPGAVDGAAVWTQLETTRVDRVTASPAFFERLLQERQRRQVTGHAVTTLSGLRKVHTGGAPVFPRLLQALAGLAPEAHIVAVYGSTEAEPIAHVDAREIGEADLAAMRAGKGLLAGMPVPEVRVRVLVDRWGQPRGELTAEALEGETLATDQIGEIVVAGAHVLPGYLGGVGDAETKFTVAGEVWHRTGDAGLLDGQGRLWLAGRCAAKLNDAEGVLYPFGVECVAMTFPAVRRAAVVALQGQRLLAVEADADPALAEALVQAVAWAKIAAVRFFPALPVDSRHNAKIDYPGLARLLERSD